MWVRALERSMKAVARQATRAVTPMVKRSLSSQAGQRSPPPGEGDWLAGVALGAGGARRYRLYRPPGVQPGERLPLLVMLHGCGQTAASFARSTRMNRLAARERFLVLYPEQDRTANPQGCWNWYDTRNYHADAEAATLMAAIDQACLLYPVDRDAVAVAGLSAGASMAGLLAVAHPQRFRALAMHAGVPPGHAHSAAGALAAMHGRRLPAAEFARAGTHALAPDGGPGNWPPLLVVHGRDDLVVSPRNARAAAAQWAGALGAVPGEARLVQRGARRAMTVTDFRRGRQLCVRLCEVDGLGHAWSGGQAGEAFSDASGPDASRLIWRFVAAQLPGAEGVRRRARA